MSNSWNSKHCLPILYHQTRPPHRGIHLIPQLKINLVQVETFCRGLSIDVDKTNVAELAECGRARWKIENETFNVLKTRGYNLEHNFGHGDNHLAAVLATLNLLAFAIHTACDLLEGLWRVARKAMAARYRFFDHIRTIVCYMVFPNWGALMRTLLTGQPPPAGLPP